MESGSDSHSEQPTSIRMSRVLPATFVILGLLGSAFMLGRNSVAASASPVEAVKFHAANPADTCQDIATWAPHWVGQGAHGGNFAIAAAQAAAAVASCSGPTGLTDKGGACTAANSADAACIPPTTVAKPFDCGTTAPVVTCQKGTTCLTGDAVGKCAIPAACLLTTTAGGANTAVPCTCGTTVCYTGKAICNVATNACAA